MSKEKPYPEIGARLKRFREHLGLSLRELTDSVGFNYTQYINWEVGERRIPVDKAAVLEARYGLSLDFIFLGKTHALPHSLVNALSDKSRPSQ